MKYALALLLTLAACTSHAQTTADKNAVGNALHRDRMARAETSRQLQERRAIGMHTGAIPRPEGFTTEDLAAKYGRGPAAPPQRRLGRAARAARNHPPLPSSPPPAKTTKPTAKPR